MSKGRGTFKDLQIVREGLSLSSKGGSSKLDCHTREGD